jgi:1,4-dihydroxy-2-naphthoate octaprenyltransferase
MTGAVLTGEAKAGAYGKLAKVEFWDYYLSVIIVWSLVPAGERFSARVAGLLLLVVLSQVCLFAAVVAFDDITGYRDGSDQLNYRGAGGTPRKLDRKPLLTGKLDIRSARRFAIAAAVVGAALAVLSIVVAPHRPWSALALTVGVVALSVQYSWGLKLSYRGGAEALIAFTGFCAVAAPVGFATGVLSPVALVQAGLFGLC